MSEDRVDLAAEIAFAIDCLFAPSEGIAWLDIPLGRFDGASPNKLIDAGRGAEVLEVLEGLSQGVPS